MGKHPLLLLLLLLKGEIDHRNALVPKSQPRPQGFFFLNVFDLNNEREGLATRFAFRHWLYSSLKLHFSFRFSNPRALKCNVTKKIIVVFTSPTPCPMERIE